MFNHNGDWDTFSLTDAYDVFFEFALVIVDTEPHIYMWSLCVISVLPFRP